MSTQVTDGDLTCDLRDVETGDVVEGWREVLARTYSLPFDVRPCTAEGEAFEATASRWSLGDVALVRTTHGAGLGRRGDAEIAASRDDVLGLLYSRKGRIQLDFNGESATLLPGELVLWDGSARGGFRTDGSVDNNTLVVPRERLEAVAPGYDEVVGRPLHSSHAATRVMASFLESLIAVVGNLDGAGRQAVASAALDLLPALIARHDGGDQPQPAKALLTAVRLYIDDQLTDPALSPASIAHAHAISLRTLYRLFESADDSVSGAIRDRRLSRCHADLTQGTDESVTVIAFRWGFRNMSHFSRLFRERYGICAREVQVAAGMRSGDGSRVG
jgi:AraC family transcriptional activator of tynA and feaB